ncbi:MAG: hypothetical protein R6W73_05640 [Candidatus Saliniplasma sp.]
MRHQSKDYIEINDNGERISKNVISILEGEEGAKDLNEEWVPIAISIEEPEKLPYLISDIKELEPTEDLRLALVRVQINAQINMKKDMDHYKRQLFVAKTIEVLLYGNLLLKPLGKKKKKKNNG